MNEYDKDLLKTCNVIDQMAVSELLDGRTFFIPSYQRGYRWTKTQMYDLCNDLLEYALKPNKDPKSFYSLQPLIVRRGNQEINGKEEDVIEVIDGQQRLTSLYIIYRALMKHVGITSSEELKENRDAVLYHIYYETRPDDFKILEDLGFKPINNRDINDIDIAHVVNAYNYVQQWLKNDIDSDHECARATWKLFGNEEVELDSVARKLFKLLNNEKDSKEPEGNAQFIWYEIGASKNAIQEFLRENKGKIHLTNTEKIRALFMQRKNKDVAGNLIQLSIAKDWELIENTLHRNDFWSFISNEADKENDRIELIFQYIYNRDCVDKKYQGDDKLFRYYYHLFNKQSQDTSIIIEEWNKIMEAFRMLQNWYQNPRIYNWIGLLIKDKSANISIADISEIYNKEEVITTEDFILELKKKVCEKIIEQVPIEQKDNKELEIENGEKYINLFFNKSSDKEQIRNLLRFLNVNILCCQIEELLRDVDKPDEQKKASDMGRSSRDEQCAIYRFPFDALDAFGWDIEHIDSATTNSLVNPDEQKQWVEEAEIALGLTLTEDKDYSKLKAAWLSTNGENKASSVSNILEFIKSLIGESDSDERKNWIGNLTLLDSGTNRIYKNKIFAKKRQIIRERINHGVYVPVCTQNIFNKTYPECTKDNLRWDFNDKKSYHKYILDTVEDFKKTKYTVKNKD